MDDRVALNGQCVLDIEPVEADGMLADGRRERILQQSYLVVVEVDIGEDILQRDIDDVTRLEEVVDA